MPVCVTKGIFHSGKRERFHTISQILVNLHGLVWLTHGIFNQLILEAAPVRHVEDTVYERSLTGCITD